MARIMATAAAAFAIFTIAGCNVLPSCDELEGDKFNQPCIMQDCENCDNGGIVFPE